MNFKDKVWKFITFTVVLLIILNPEMFALALFIDAIGLEMFLMLLQIQVMAIFGLFFNTKVKLVCIYVKGLFLWLFPINYWRNIRENPDAFILAVPGPAMLMNTLAGFVLISVVFNVY